MRRLAPVLVLALVVACGGGPDKAPTPAKATAAANAINLTDSDGPTGFDGAPYEADATSAKADKQLATCVGASDPTVGRVVDVKSTDFTAGTEPNQQEIYSDVTVLKTEGQAHKDLEAFRGSKTSQCIGQLVKDLVSAGAGSAAGVTFSTPTVVDLKPSHDGVDGAFGYKLTMTITAGGLHLPVALNLLGAVKGHTALSLNIAAIGPAVSDDLRDQLFHTLLTRLKKSAV